MTAAGVSMWLMLRIGCVKNRDGMYVESGSKNVNDWGWWGTRGD